MKRIIVLAAVLMFAASLAYAEDSPDRSHVKIVSVPRQCLESGSAEEGGYKYTCNKVEPAEVWNDLESHTFDKDIFEAWKAPTETTRIGFVVRQDTRYTIAQQATKGEVAEVVKKDNYKWRYTRR